MGGIATINYHRRVGCRSCMANCPFGVRSFNFQETLKLTLTAVILSVWIDKGLGLVSGGFILNPLGKVTEYSPTGVEILICIGIYAIGGLILAGLYKIALSVRTSP